MSEQGNEDSTSQDLVVQEMEVPPGLELLAQVDQIFIKPEVEFLEVMFNVECNNRYSIVNSVGERILYAAENTVSWARCCLSKVRPFDINVLDHTGQIVLQITRSCTCGLVCCSECCGNTVEVKAGVTGEPLGSVAVFCMCCQPGLHILNVVGEIVLMVLGPNYGKCCGLSMGTANFDIVLPDGRTNVGQITKLPSGEAKEILNDVVSFGATFPIDLDPRVKAVILGAVLSIDFMYFEASGNRSGR